jgi:hypothetical protein
MDKRMDKKEVDIFVMYRQTQRQIYMYPTLSFGVGV